MSISAEVEGACALADFDAIDASDPLWPAHVALAYGDGYARLFVCAVQLARDELDDVGAELSRMGSGATLASCEVDAPGLTVLPPEQMGRYDHAFFVGLRQALDSAVASVLARGLGNCSSIAEAAALAMVGREGSHYAYGTLSDCVPSDGQSRVADLCRLGEGFERVLSGLGELGGRGWAWAADECADVDPARWF